MYLCNEKKDTGAKKASCILLAFLAAFSQEQIAALVIVTYMLIILFRRIGNKEKAPKYLYGVSISAFAGGIITIFAPGNMAIASSGFYEEFYNRGILSRTINNVGYIINDNVGLYNCVFVFFLTVFCGTAVAIVLILYAFSNMVLVIMGYRNNYEINQRNYHELVEDGKQNDNGGTVDKIVLYKLKND